MQSVFSEEFISTGKLSAKNPAQACTVYHNMSYSQFTFLYSVIAHLGGLFLSLGWDRGTVCSGYLYALFHPVHGHHTLGSGDKNIKNASSLITVR